MNPREALAVFHWSVVSRGGRRPQIHDKSVVSMADVKGQGMVQGSRGSYKNGTLRRPGDIYEPAASSTGCAEHTQGYNSPPRVGTREGSLSTPQVAAMERTKRGEEPQHHTTTPNPTCTKQVRRRGCRGQRALLRHKNTRREQRGSNDHRVANGVANGTVGNEYFEQRSEKEQQQHIWGQQLYLAQHDAWCARQQTCELKELIRQQNEVLLKVAASMEKMVTLTERCGFITARQVRKEKAQVTTVVPPSPLPPPQQPKPPRAGQPPIKCPWIWGYTEEELEGMEVDLKAKLEEIMVVREQEHTGLRTWAKPPSVVAEDKKLREDLETNVKKAMEAMRQYNSCHSAASGAATRRRAECQAAVQTVEAYNESTKSEDAYVCYSFSETGSVTGYSHYYVNPGRFRRTELCRANSAWCDATGFLKG